MCVHTCCLNLRIVDQKFDDVREVDGCKLDRQSDPVPILQSMALESECMRGPA